MKTLNILIAPNSFKECADSVEISGLIENSLKELLPKEILKKMNFTKIPISDGGDGFLKVTTEINGLELLNYKISTPFDMTKFDCKVGYSSSLKKIYIESANVLGLKLIPAEKRKPLLLSSKGMGELLKQIASDVDNLVLNVEEVIIGIGGTGTNDLGLGLAESFGLKLLDDNGSLLEILPKNFELANNFMWTNPMLPFKISTVIDVDNLLLGDKGAARIFGPQKGATEFDVEKLEKGFANILKISGNDQNNKFISGAGGGLAAGLNLFFNASYKFSNEFVNNDLGLSNKSKYDLIITGEGSFDLQSLMNKGTMIVINEFMKTNTPIFVICGDVEGNLNFGDNVRIIKLSNYFDSKKESILKIAEGINKACREITEQVNFIEKVN